MGFFSGLGRIVGKVANFAFSPIKSFIGGVASAFAPKRTSAPAPQQSFTPAAPPPPPTNLNPAVDAAADNERRQARGRAATILTGPSGFFGEDDEEDPTSITRRKRLTGF